MIRRSIEGTGVESQQVTPSELERSIGLPAESLQATVAYYNRHAAQGRDPLFHKGAAFLQPLTNPPYAAIDCRTAHALYATFTLGGLHTRPTGEVLGPDDQIIPGLYAAGRTTSGLAAYGYVSGISLADGTFCGRLAGRTAATAPE
jgi:predicted oxidoreductase